MITIHDVEQGSPEWHALRDPLYTGTDADKLLTTDPGTLKIVDGEVSAYALKAATDFKGNFYTRRGHVLEDEAIELYEQIYHTQVDRPGFITNDRYPSCGYSPDGLDGMVLMECKAFNIEKHLKMIKEGLPFKVQSQTHFGLTITELKLARVLLYNPDLARRTIINEAGEEIPNPQYDPKKALHIIEIKSNRNITNNFKRRLAPQPVGA